MGYILIAIISVIVIAMGVRLGISPLVEKPHYPEEKIIIKLKEVGVLNKDELDKVEKEYYWRKNQRAGHKQMRAVLQELYELELLTETELAEKLALLEHHINK